MVRSNTVQTVEVGGDPSLARQLGLLEGSSEGRWGEEKEEDSDSEGSERVRRQHRSQSPVPQIIDISVLPFFAIYMPAMKAKTYQNVPKT